MLVLANIEGMNAEFMRMGLLQGERLKRLNQIAIRQMQVLATHGGATTSAPAAGQKLKSSSVLASGGYRGFRGFHGCD